MQCCDQENTSDEDLNAVIDKILIEDQREKMIRKRRNAYQNVCKESEERDHNRTQNFPGKCKMQYTGVVKSKRFSLYLMEAMRALQRKREKKSSFTSKSLTFCEIVNYIKSNFPSDGDLEAQVRTALKQTCRQGFVKNEGKDKYYLRGPFACHLSNVKNANFIHSNLFCCSTNSSNHTQKSSGTNVSVTSCTEEDAFQRSIASNINNLQHKMSFHDYDENATMKLNLSRCMLGLRENRRESNSLSSVREDNNVVGYIHNPTQEIEAGIHVSGVIEVDDHDNKIDTSIESDQEIDVISDDSIIQELKNERPKDQAHDHELKRWIQNCKRECARRALHGLDQRNQK